MKQKIPCTNKYGRGLSRRYSASGNTPPHAETLLYSLERAAGGIDLHVNEDKTEYMWIKRCIFPFPKTGNLGIAKNCGPLKLADKLTYLGSNVPSTEKDINTRQAKA